MTNYDTNSFDNVELNLEGEIEEVFNPKYPKYNPSEISVAFNGGKGYNLPPLSNSRVLWRSNVFLIEGMLSWGLMTSLGVGWM